MQAAYASQAHEFAIACCLPARPAMLQRLIDHPWMSVVFVVTIAGLWLAAAIRMKRDRMLKHRAKVNRRDKLRAERERRWQTRD